jgi:two-component system chemotaxis sensor kinase CheA
MDELTSTFVNESRDQLIAMEDGLLRLEQNPDDADNLGAIFRAAHTIKGGSGVVECHFIEAFTHKVENVLDKLRNGEIPVSGELSTVMLECCDHLGALLDVLAAGSPHPDPEVQARGDALLATLTEQFLGGSARDDALPVEHSSELETSGGGVVNTDAWHISVRFGPGVLRNGMDPLSFLNFLASLGEITAISTLADAIPAAAEMDPESCYLGFEIHFQTRASKAQIEQVFEFVRDECTLYILPPHSKIDEYITLINESPEGPMRLGEILVRSGALTQAELDEGLAVQSRGAGVEVEGAGAAQTPIGEILVEQRVVHKELVEAAANRQSVLSDKKALDARMIRVQADKLDQLIDLVGEMVIAGAGANLLAQRSGQSDLMESTSVLLRLVEDIRDSALQLRMVQIGETFNRFHRVVRDVSRDLGKDIELVITGADAELDKTVVEKISDPLTHMVRNAIDHGIEAAEARVAAGKPARGRVQPECLSRIGQHRHRSRRRRRRPEARARSSQKAIAKGLLGADAEPSACRPRNHQAALRAGLLDRRTGQQPVRTRRRPGCRQAQHREPCAARPGASKARKAPAPPWRSACRSPWRSSTASSWASANRPMSCRSTSVEECIELRQRCRYRATYLNLRGAVLPLRSACVELLRPRRPGGIPSRENVVVVKYAGEQGRPGGRRTAWANSRPSSSPSASRSSPTCVASAARPSSAAAKSP